MKPRKAKRPPLSRRPYATQGPGRRSAARPTAAGVRTIDAFLRRRASFQPNDSSGEKP